MSTVNENTADVLNDLIRINNDRVEGYEKAIDQSEKENLDLITAFEKMITQSEDYVTDLGSLVIKYGGRVATDSTTLGKIYRTWMDVKIAFSANDRKNILSECEFGEDAAQKAYKMALDEKELTEEARSLITVQKNALKNSHDLIKNWRDREKVEA
jgi:uncharacterized protein (TIGR02284 family)